MKAVILAGGKGPSLVPFSAHRSAAMVQFGGRCVIEHSLRLLRMAGIKNIRIVVRPDEDGIIKKLGHGDHHGVNIEYIHQTHHDGIGGAIYETKDTFQPGDYFLLSYGDTLTRENIFSHTFSSHHQHKGPIATVCLAESAERYGAVYMSGDTGITKIIEKPKDEDLGNYILAGVYILPYSFFSYLEQSDFDMNGAMTRLIAKETLHACIWEENWVDIRYPWDILKANQIQMENWNQTRIDATAQVSEQAMISGSVAIGEGAVISGGAIIRGPCYIGPGTFIGHHVLIRSYTSLGANSVVGFGVELKNCVIMDNSRIGRLSFIGDSVVGAGADIGAGSMTINTHLDKRTVCVHILGKDIDSGLDKLGAFIGDGALIGASNSMPAGCVINDQAVVPHRLNNPDPQDGMKEDS